MGCFDSFLGGNNGCCWIIILIAIVIVSAAAVKPYIPPIQSHKRAAVSAARFPMRGVRFIWGKALEFRTHLCYNTL